MPALALTDHGCLFGAWSFHKAAKKAGIKPILGMEAYVAPGDRRDRSRSGQGKKAYYHLVLNTEWLGTGNVSSLIVEAVLSR